MNLTNRIKPNIKKTFEKLFNQYSPDKAILFGSYAYGHPTKESDIDLFIVKDTPENPIKRRVTVRRILNITDPDFPSVSPIVLTPKELRARLKIGDQFIEEILRKGLLLYAK